MELTELEWILFNQVLAQKIGKPLALNLLSRGAPFAHAPWVLSKEELKQSRDGVFPMDLSPLEHAAGILLEKLGEDAEFALVLWESTPTDFHFELIAS